MSKNIREVIFGREYGLGDTFLISGICHWLAKKYDKVFITAEPHNYVSARHLFSNNHKIEVLPLNQPVIHWQPQHTFLARFESFSIPIIDQDLWTRRPQGVLWYHWLYEQFGLKFHHHYEYFCKPQYGDKAIALYTQLTQNIGDNYRLVHNASSANSSYSLSLDRNTQDLPTIWVNPNLSTNFFDWAYIIDKAKEIHVTHSSFFWYIDSLKNYDLPAEIYLHDIRKSNDPLDLQDIKWHNPRWNIIEYGKKI